MVMDWPDSMMHPGATWPVRRRQRILLALLRGFRWSRPMAARRARELAASALQAAAVEVLREQRDRALIDRALRRLGTLAALAAAHGLPRPRQGRYSRMEVKK